MEVVRIGDPADPRLRDFLDLRDTAMRAAREPEEGFFLAEGELTIRRALAAAYRPRAVLTTEEWLESLIDIEAPTLVVADDVLRATTGFPVHRGALASFERKPLPSLDAVVGPARRVVVLEDLADHTNVGAIFRSAAALGWDAVVLTPRCGDPLYRRAVRTSMGAAFTVPWTRLDHRAGVESLRGAGLAVIALTPDGDQDIADLEVPERLALVVGTEGPGVSERWRASVDAQVRIAMHGGIDSLNVSNAAAIAMYVLA
jgi:tRNA G18 (ribose-2'-O)-methylase SpoU